jgi:hypothetical protein
MSTDGRNEFLDSLRGSHCERVLSHAVAPLLTVRSATWLQLARTSKTDLVDIPTDGYKARHISLGDQGVAIARLYVSLISAAFQSLRIQDFPSANSTRLMIAFS